MKKTKTLIAASLLAFTLSGCSSINTALNKQDLDVESNLSHAIVLEPRSPSDRVVYARVRDVSGNQMRADMQKLIESHLEKEGFKITSDPKKANLMLNATIMSASKTTAEEANRMLASGYKGGIEGAVTGAAITQVTGGSNSDVAKAGLLMAAAGFLADSVVEDAYYSFVMDVQLRERALSGDKVYNATSNYSARGGSDGNTATASLSKSSVERNSDYNWIIYETRIVTTANKMNLEIEEAIPAVQERTAYSLSEMLM